MVASAVAKAAMDSGVAKFPITDWDAYKISLDKRISEHIAKIAESACL
jgi:malate dehydrogenase (oxaloacetate-decarboxylating)(NADP+)